MRNNYLHQVFTSILVLFTLVLSYGQAASISGELKTYHKLTFDWQAIQANETTTTFTDLRFNVIFTSPGGQTYTVPGYFAADGNAGESSASSGNVWRAHFTALETGSWSYQVSFRSGNQIAASLDPLAGSPVSIDGASGSFIIGNSDKTGLDFRSKGRLQYVGEHFLQWTDGDYFLKLGTNSPEILLFNSDFDNTSSSFTYGPHVQDWNSDDPTWQGGKGKGTIGAINYISESGLNVHYFVIHRTNEAMSPWVNPSADHYTFDVSKLDQWQIVMDHMMAKGVMAHIVMAESLIQSIHEKRPGAEGDPLFADSRKIYYREMMARFGYLNAITWNIGEEHAWDRNDNYGDAVTTEQILNFAQYISDLAYYDDHIVIHNGPAGNDDIYTGLMGTNSAITGTSLQGLYGSSFRATFSVEKWKDQSAANGKKWVIAYDEAYNGGATENDKFRYNVLWPTLTSGGAGVEHYTSQGNDTSLEDYRVYAQYWQEMKHAQQFFQNNSIPYWEMNNQDDLVSAGRCLGKDFETYVIYLQNGGSTNIDLVGEYSVKWYDPRNGGGLQDGTVTNVSGGTQINLGNPPSNTALDWVVLLQSTQTGPVSVTGVELALETLTLGTGSSYTLNGTVLPPNADNTTLTWSSNNSSVVSVNGLGEVTGNGEGTAIITATSVDGGFTDQVVVTVVSSSEFCNASGTILMERYEGIGGTSLSDLFNAPNYPDSPSYSEEITDFEIPTNILNNYGTRVSGYLCPPESGIYYFWISGDDNSQLNLSTDSNPSNKSTIATIDAWTSSQEWDKFPSQKSVGIYLELGETYYIEAFMKEGTGGDNLAVGWRKPSDGDGTFPVSVIPGSVLSPNFDSTLPQPIAVTGVNLTPVTYSMDPQQSVQLFTTVSPGDADNKAVNYASNNTNVAGVDANGLVTAFNPGTAVITVTTVDGGFTATSTITVNDDGVIEPPIDAPVNFAQTEVTFDGIPDISAGTSLMFGPDGRLYVAEYTGKIKIYNLERLETGEYQAVALEELSDIQNTQDHNDDGTLFSNTNRETIGIAVAGTPTNPEFYVTHSDFRIGGGGGGGNGDLGLDTNSGIITRFSWNGSSWDVVDIVRGLPRSEENHATNGLEYVTIGGNPYLIVAQGGHTNGGSPSTNFAYTTEYALSAAVLSINLNMINNLPIKNDNGRNYIYDLPTLDDPTRPNANGITDPDNPNYNGIDINDPWGGNDGLNQAIWDPNGPVQIYSPGYRNAYDLVVTESGALYITDNGANGGWGGFPENEGNGNLVTNNYVNGEPGSSSSSGGEQINNEDHLIKITDNIQTYLPGSFYGGHPNPVRANPSGAGLFVAPATSGLTGASFRTQVYDPDGSTPGSTSIADQALPANWPPIPTNLANPAEGDWRGPGELNPDGPEKDLITIWGTNTNGIDEYTASNFDGAMKGDLIAGVNNGVLRRVQLDSNGNLALLTDTFASGLGGNALGITCNSDNDPFPGTIWAVTLNGKLIVLEPQDFVTCIDPTDPTFDPLADYDNDGYTNQDELDNGTDICNGGSQPSDFDKAAGGMLISDLNDTDDDNDGILDELDPFQLGQPLASGSDAFTLPVQNELFSDNPLLQGYLGLGFTGLMNNGEANPNWLNWLDRRDDLSEPNPNDILGGAIGAMTMQMTSGTALGSANTQEKAFQYGVQTGTNTGIYTIQGSLVNFNDPLQLYGSQAPTNGELGIFIGDGTQSNYIKFVLTPSGLVGMQEIDDIAQTPVEWPIAEENRPQSGAMLYFVIDPTTGQVSLQYSFDGGGTSTIGSITAQGAILNAIQNLNSDLAVGFIGTSNDPTKELEGTWDLLNVFDSSGLEIIDQAVVRINAGGALVAATDEEVNWSDNATVGAQSEINYSVNVGEIVPSGLTYANRHSSIPDYIDETTFNELFSQERFDLPGGEEMTYAIPVTNGFYRVNFFMGNSFFGTNDPGERVFDINLEDALALNDVDLAAEFGHLSAGMLSEVVAVSDGTLNITFIHGVENPLINAIEVISIQGDVFPITLSNIADQESTIDEVIDLAVQAVGGSGEESFTFEMTGAPLGLTIDASTGVISGTIDTNAFLGGIDGLGTYEVEVQVSKPSSFTKKTQFIWTVMGPLTLDPIMDQESIVGSSVSIEASAVGGNVAAETQYALAGAPDGISINPTTGILSGVITPAALIGGAGGDGIHEVTLTASQVGGEEASIVFTWTVMEFPVILYRINAGGEQVVATDTAVDWERNDIVGTDSGSSYSVNVGEVVPSGLQYSNRHSSIPFYIDEATFTALFAQERFDLSGGEEMNYALPVENGTYKVNIYLGNSFFGTNDPGERVFDIALEGVVLKENMDMAAEFGHTVGGMVSLTSVVTDGMLDISFLHVVENPLLNAIEVIRVEGDTNPMVVQQIGSQNNFIGDVISELSISASGGDPGANFRYTLEGQPLGIEVEPTNGLIYGTIDDQAFTGGPAGNGVYNVKVKVFKNGSFPHTQYFSWAVAGPLTINTVEQQVSIVGTPVSLPVDAAGGDINEPLVYSMSGAPAGIEIDPVSGLITGNVADDASQGGPLGNGVYQVTVTVSRTGSADVSTSFDWTVTEYPTILYRINAAGQAVVSTDGSPDWEANASEGPFNGSNYTVNTGLNGPSGITYDDRDSSIPSYIDATMFAQLFAQERFDIATGEEMTYSIPLKNGEYIVNIYTGNSFFGTAEAGKRVFSIEMEGAIAFQDLDLITTFGHLTAGMLTKTVNVSDGVLDITFLHGVENPLLNAIEIATFDDSLVPILVNGIADQSSEPGISVNLDLVQASGGDINLPFSYSIEGQPDGISIDPSTGVLSGVLNADADLGGPLGNGVYTVSITVNKQDQDPVTVSFTWTIAPYTWQDLNEDLSYTPRHECSFVQAGAKFFLMGGREKPKEIDVYDYTTNTWKTISNSPPEEFNHFQAVEYNGLVWIIGAFKDNNFPEEVPAEHIWTFNPVTEVWTQGAKIPVDRRRGSSGLVVYNDKFYLVAGNTIGHDGGYVAWFDEYDPLTNTWTKLPDAPRARDHFHAAIVGDKLYAAGGRLSGGEGGTFKPTIAEVDVFDFQTGTWSTLTEDLPTPRGATTAVNFQEQLVIIGGEVENEVIYGTTVSDALTITEAYDPVSASWARLPDMNHDRHGTQAIVSGDGIFILAGSDNLGGGFQQNMEVYGTNAPEGIVSINSKPSLPELVEFAAGETKAVLLSSIDGNIGVPIQRIHLSGSELFALVSEEPLENIFLKSGGVMPIEVSVSNPAVDATAVLTVEYNNGETVSSILTTGQGLTGLINPNDQYNNEGEQISLPVINTTPGVVPNFSATNLPPNLSIDGATGVISGVLASDTANGTFLEEDGFITIEAESGTLSGGWTITNEDDEVGIEAAGGNYFNSTAGGSIFYKVKVTEPGVYRFVWNNAFTGNDSGNSNDSWLKFDNNEDVWFFGYQGTDDSEQAIIDELLGDQSEIVFPKGSSRVTPATTPAGSGLEGYFKVFRAFGTSGKYSWTGFVNDEDGYDPYVWFVNPGEYTFEIKERSAGHRIDKIVLYKSDWYSFVDDTFEDAEQSVIVDGLGGASNGSPYAVTIDYSDETGTDSVSFDWYIGEPGDDPEDFDPCGDATVLSSDDFEGGFGNWIDGGTDALWVNNAQVSASGNYSIGLQDNTNTSLITSSVYDLVEYNEVNVEFNYYVVSFDNENEDFWFQVSTDGGASFTTVAEWNLGDEFENNTAKQGQVNLPGPFTSNMVFRFRADASGNADDVYLDDIVITACKSIVPVENIQLSPELLTLIEGDSQIVSAAVTPVDATDQSLVFTTSNSAVATVDETGNVLAIAEGEAIITATNVASGQSDTVNVTVLTSEVGNCVATGTIKYERYEGISGVELAGLFAAASYPDNPTVTQELTQFQAPINAADNYGARISGYLCPPETGTYYFWLSGDDHSQLNLSTDESKANIVTIAAFAGYTGPQQWDKYAEQKSIGISLQAGKTYYIEAFVKEAGGGDHLTVGWRKPSDGNGSLPVEVIPGSVLSPELIEQPDCDFTGGPPVASVAVNNVDCNGDEGGFTFSFDDNVNRTNIEFSLDGGLTYPYNVSDNIGSTTVSNIAAGEYVLWVRWGNDQCPQYLGEFTVADQCNGCDSDGFITMERYDNIGGVELFNLFNAPAYPDSPSSTQNLTTFEIPINVADNYGVRVRGTICAPETGTYYFWISGDDESQLNLSTDQTEANKQNIAAVPGWSSSQEWNKFAVQKSGAVQLVQGQTYYIEAFMKEAGGGDNLAVGWRKPSDGNGASPVEVIPGNVLSPYSGEVDDCNWTFAGNEGETISFSGTKKVRYGANGTFVEGTFTDGVACNNTTFGDPLVGVVKFCELCEEDTTPEPEPCDALSITQSDIVSFAGVQDLGTASVIENGAGLQVQNNAWKAILFDYTITANTVLEFEFKSDIQGEQHAIGLTAGNGINQPQAFTLYGTQVINNDIEAFKDYTGSGYKKYVIPVGQFYTGQADRLFFTADHDGGGQNGISSFKNIKVYEEGECNSTSVTDVLVTPGQYTLYLSDLVQLEATVLPLDATNPQLNWTSSNASIASVNANGQVTGNASGVAQITATAVDGGAIGAVTITVTDAFANCTSSTGPPLTTVSILEPTCGSSDGGFVFTFEDHPNRTNIEFSIDGGQTYPYYVADGIGSTTAANLGVGTYELWVRWGNNECPVYLGEYILGADCEVLPSNLPWIENFDGLANGSSTDTGSTAWSTSNTGGTQWTVQNGALQTSSANLGASASFGTWSSEEIDISGAGQVQVVINVTDLEIEQKENADFLQAYYSLDGGAPVLFAQLTNDIVQQDISVGNLSGSTLQIILQGQVSWENEFYVVNSVSVSEQNAVALGAKLLFTEVSIVPNPAVSETELIVRSNENISIESYSVFDMTGRLIKTVGQVDPQLRSTTSEALHIALPYPPGNYLMQIRMSDGSIQTKRLLVK